MTKFHKAVWGGPDYSEGPNVGRLAGRPVRLRIRMRAAKLYAFQFVELEKV